MKIWGKDEEKEEGAKIDEAKVKGSAGNSACKGWE